MSPPTPRPSRSSAASSTSSAESPRGLHGRLLDLPLRAFVDGLAAEEPAPGGGSAAALAVAMAAALIAKVARASPSWLERESAVAQAERLRQRTAPLAQADAEAYEEALAALNLPSELEPEVRGMAIGEVLGRAVEVPLAIADAGADVAVLAAVAAERGTLDRRADAIAAALLALGRRPSRGPPGRGEPGRRARGRPRAACPCRRRGGLRGTPSVSPFHPDEDHRHVRPCASPPVAGLELPGRSRGSPGVPMEWPGRATRERAWAQSTGNGFAFASSTAASTVTIHWSAG